MELFKFCLTELAFLSFVGVCHSTSKQDISERPNILLILADDMGYGDVSNIGNKYIKTPNLDKMSQRGINFENFYVSPVCAPTRASLLTGKFHQKVGVRGVTNGFESIDPDAVTLSEILKKEGYRTGIFGKWHLGEYYPSVPNNQGFDEFLGFRTGHTSNYYDAVLEHNGKPEQTKGYITDMLTEKAIEFMDSYQGQPFFCYLPYNAPHAPLQIDEEKFNPFLEMGLDERTSKVYAMVENIDWNIGRIVDYLREKKILENTVIIFMSDNGPISGWQVPMEKMRFNAGLRDQKFTTYEGGVRTQCYWMWKNHWRPFVDENNIAAHIDVLPTLASILGIQLPDSLGIDGIDLSPILENQALLAAGRIYFEDYELFAVRSPELFKGGAARKGKWKLHGGSELYNLTDDPAEHNNVAEKYPQILAELKEEYKKYYTSSYEDRYFYPLPIKLGYKEENPIYIKAHHGKAFGNVQMMGYRDDYNTVISAHPFGVDGDWTSNWKIKGDKMEWSVEFVDESLYEIGMTVSGRLGENTCFFNVKVNEHQIKVGLPRIHDEKGWQYIPLTKVTASGKTNIGFVLDQISITDNLNINELVITRIN